MKMIPHDPPFRPYAIEVESQQDHDDLLNFLRVAEVALCPTSGAARAKELLRRISEAARVWPSEL